ncbi:MAG: hypothetical protein GC150_16475 [Rhizobiales bacterium]|nr:hypothetical protein [Hyphomicrobiales bacterium]
MGIVRRPWAAPAGAFFVLVLLGLAPAPARAADFCDNPQGAAERTICRHGFLIRLDRILNVVYEQFGAQFHGAALRNLRNEQRGWLISRNACRNDVICIANAYDERIAQLEGGDGSSGDTQADGGSYDNSGSAGGSYDNGGSSGGSAGGWGNGGGYAGGGGGSGGYAGGGGGYAGNQNGGQGDQCPVGFELVNGRCQRNANVDGEDPCGPGFVQVPETDGCIAQVVVDENNLMPMPGRSYGGIVREGPYIERPRVASLREGEPITVLLNSGVEMNGYYWYRIRFQGGRIGYHWGGIFCSGRQLNGVLARC